MKISLYAQLLASLILSSYFNISNAGEFLHPDKAFIFSSEAIGSSLTLDWKIADGYYLYEQRFNLLDSQQRPLKHAEILFSSLPYLKHDKNFGDVNVFFRQAHGTVNLSRILSKEQTTLYVEYQGCSKDGLCYQPQLTALYIALANSDNELPKDIPTATAEMAIRKTPITHMATKLKSMSDINKFLADSTLLTTIGVFFLLGVGLSLTPCILPMIPILSGIIVGQGKTLSTKQGVALSSSYVLGMAVTYALAGIAAATFGAQGNLQLYMQNPWVIGIFSLVFVALSLSMFGLYTFSLPTGLQNKLHQVSGKQRGGKFTGVFFMGALSSLVVSPCVSAPLAGALVFISSTGNKYTGGLALFFLGVGLGLPLIAIGAGGGKFVPKAGVWMEQVKVFFGVVLLSVAIWLSTRILPGPVSLLLWAFLFITYAIYTGALEPAAQGLQRLRRALSFSLLFYGCLIFVGAVTGGGNPLNPIEKLLATNGSNSSVKGHTQLSLFTRVENRQQLNEQLELAKQANTPVVLDFYADWCTACIALEKHVFSKQEVQEALLGFSLIQIDITKNSQEHKNILDDYGVFGPPSMLFFNSHGTEVSEHRIQGELTKDAFIAHIRNPHFAVQIRR